MPTPADDDVDDRDFSPKALIRKLDKTNEILVRANARLDRLRAGFAVPPTPDQPALITALQAVLTQAEHSARVTNEMLAKLTTRG